jgi:hypothetical protein
MHSNATASSGGAKGCRIKFYTDPRLINWSFPRLHAPRLKGLRRNGKRQLLLRINRNNREEHISAIRLMQEHVSKVAKARNLRTAAISAVCELKMILANATISQ